MFQNNFLGLAQYRIHGPPPNIMIIPAPPIVHGMVAMIYCKNIFIVRLPLEPSALRFITCFEMNDPFVHSFKDENAEKMRQLEFAVIKVIKKNLPRKRESKQIHSWQAIQHY